ncbi:serine acetyltransferase [Pseudorhodoferax sp.]|uniref:serine acetyltransferase n=1 Tax=Pseudorhodoferax sp. TaxID=1993553 RepID=UPI002DD633C3|nr:serine acetyltransferase [Pseudorhodoferax sp.]
MHETATAAAQPPRERSDSDWAADLARCNESNRPFLREQSLWALWVYRFGRRVDAMPRGLRQRLLSKAYSLLFRTVETWTGISIPKETRVGPGLRIFHFGGIFVHPGSVLGSGCTLRQGVTIGNRVAGGPCPVLEDGVELGAYAQVIGGIRLGAGCRVGAMAVVLCDVPPGHTAVGNPARIVAAAPEARHG